MTIDLEKKEALSSKTPLLWSKWTVQFHTQIQMPLALSRIPGGRFRPRLNTVSLSQAFRNPLT